MVLVGLQPVSFFATLCLDLGSLGFGTEFGIGSFSLKTILLGFCLDLLRLEIIWDCGDVGNVNVYQFDAGCDFMILEFRNWVCASLGSVSVCCIALS
jgi:hypothetical protein